MGFDTGTCVRCHRLISPQIPYLLGSVGQQMDYQGWLCPTSIGSYNFGQFYSIPKSYAVCIDCWMEADGLQPFNQRYTMHCEQCLEEEKRQRFAPSPGCGGATSPGGERGEHRFHLWGWKMCPVHWKVCEAWLHQFDEFRKKTGVSPQIGEVVQAPDAGGEWKDVEVIGVGGTSMNKDRFHFEGRFVGGELPLLLTLGYWGAKLNKRSLTAKESTLSMIMLSLHGGGRSCDRLKEDR